MKQSFFDNPKSTRLIVRILVACCVILFVLDAVIHRHTTHPWEELFGFYAIYGFVACVLLVVIAKELRKLLMRDEKYYDLLEEQNSNNITDPASELESKSSEQKKTLEGGKNDE